MATFGKLRTLYKRTVLPAALGLTMAAGAAYAQETGPAANTRYQEITRSTVNSIYQEAASGLEKGIKEAMADGKVTLQEQRALLATARVIKELNKEGTIGTYLNEGEENTRIKRVGINKIAYDIVSNLEGFDCLTPELEKDLRMMGYNVTVEGNITFVEIAVPFITILTLAFLLKPSSMY